MKQDKDAIRIYAHLPLIIDALHNEALRSRRVMIDASGGKRRIHCNVMMVHPWVSLIEVINDEKKTISFKVEDGRLVNPARSLAILALNGIKRFTPFRFLTAEQRADIQTNVDTVAPPIQTQNEVDMD